MATTKILEECLTKKSSSQGVVTRHLNSLKKLIDDNVTTARDEIEQAVNKLCEAKARFDELQVRAMELSAELDVDNTELEATAVRIDTEVTSACERAREWLGKSSEVLPSDQTDHASHSVKSPTSVQLKERLLEQERRHKEESNGMMQLINELKVKSSSVAASTPAVSSQRVTFSDNNLSSIDLGRDSDPHYGTVNQDSVYARNATPRNTSDYSVLRGNLRGVNPKDRNHHPASSLYLGLDDRTAPDRQRHPSDGSSYAFHQQLLNQTERQHRSFLASICVPAISLGKFDGSPLEYVQFFNNFDELVDNVEDNPRVKLSSLIAHCEGKALKAISGYANQSASSGYDLARKKLRSKFGSPFIISQAWISKLLDYPPLSGAEELDNFALDLGACRDSLTSMGYDSQLRSTHTLGMLVSKLPLYLRNKWRKIHRQNRDDPSFDAIAHLVELVQECADEAGDPVFGESAISRVHAVYEGNVNPGGRGRVAGNGRRAAVNAIDDVWNERLSDTDSPTECCEDMFFTSRRERSTCSSCGSTSHFTSRCRRFKELTPLERIEFVKDRNLCVLCLSSDHRADRCRLPWKCQEPNCGERHHTALHPGYVAKSQKDTSNVNSVTSGGEEFTYFNLTRACLPLTPVTIRNGNKSVKTYALLDTGSTLTLCNKRLENLLGLDTRVRRRVNINTVNDRTAERCAVVKFSISGSEYNRFLPVRRAMSMERLPISIDHLARAEQVRNWSHLDELNLPELPVDSVDILIGQDNAHLLKPITTQEGEGDFDPYGVLTPLGWTVYGSVDIAPPLEVVNFTHDNKCKDLELKESLQKFWSVEKVPECAHISKEDQHVLELWNSTFDIVDGHVTLPIPYKVDPPRPPNNMQMAIGALMSLTRQLQKNSGEREQFITAMKKDFDEGFAEVVPDDEIDLEDYTYYLLFHGVDHLRKPNVKRIVKHGTTKHQGVCLADFTYTGPDLMNKMLGVLLRFRQFSSALTSDIVGMFNMVKVFGPHRDSLRFVWWKDNVLGSKIVVCRMTTHIFGTGWAPSAAGFALKKLAEVNADLYIPRVIQTITEDFYVDDWLNSETEDSTTNEVADGVIRLLATGGFDLTKFASNKRKVLEGIDLRRRAKELARIDLSSSDSLPLECTLGAGWNPQRDIFFKSIVDPKPVTRRGLTSSVSLLFDPMGLIAPFLVPAKRLMQQACHAGGGWDELLSLDIEEQWARWLRDAERVDQLEVQRWIGCDKKSKNTLHHFGDAAEVAFGGASYLLVEYEDGTKKCGLLMGKSRLAPIKTQSIPCLEMCAAVIIVKLDEALRSYLSVPLEISQFWTDSSIVLYLLMMDPGCLKTFMGNRSAYIQDNTQITQWHHVPSKMNPANLISRGTTLEELSSSDLWFRGPGFFVGNVAFWPPMVKHPKTAPEVATEIKRSKPIYAAWPEIEECIVGCTVVDDPEDTILTIRDEFADCHVASCYTVCAITLMHKSKFNESLLDFAVRFSSWIRAIRSVAWLIRLAGWHFHCDVQHRQLSVYDLENAELAYTRLTQALFLDKDILKHKSISKLCPVLLDGVWRVGGRFENAPFSFQKKRPAIVPEDSPMALQLLRWYHISLAHAGPDRVIANSREKFWVINARSLLSKIANECVVCVKLNSRPLEQQMAPLHETRTQVYRPPFTCTGVDLFGPLIIAIRRTTDKRYGVLFTCLTTRAVHLELAENLSVSAFLDCLERFVNRRGTPRQIKSDNGTNFVGSRSAIEEANKVLRSDELQRSVTERRIIWTFNAPSGSHQGGCWERLIRMARQVIMSITQGKRLPEGQLSTVLCKAEGIMNARPLTCFSEDESSLEVITPAHLLITRAPEMLFKQPLDGTGFRDMWKNIQGMAAEFWKEWLLMYVPELQRRTRWTKIRENLKVGELVIVVNDLTTRMDWPVGIVEEIFEGKDGLVRNTVVRTLKGRYRRPIQKLLRLEADCG